MRTFSWVKWVDQLSQLAMKLSTLLTLCLVFLTFQQVIARYFFSASSVALQELQWHLFAGIFLFGASETLRADGHVRVDVFYSKFSIKSKAIVDVFGVLLLLIPSMIVLFFVGFQFVEQALDYQNIRALDHYTKNLLNPKSSFYQLSEQLEAWVRTNLLMGEASSDPGGLEARWMVKALIPLGAGLTLLQGMNMLVKKLYLLRKGSST